MIILSRSRIQQALSMLKLLVKIITSFTAFFKASNIKKRTRSMRRKIWKLLQILILVLISSCCLGFLNRDHGVGFCGPTDDKDGSWWESSNVKMFQNQMDYYQQKLFFGYGNQEQDPYISLSFDRVFIPERCWMFHLDKEGVIQAANSYAARYRQPFRLLLLGDSATRGLYCGLERIMSGSELLGPSEGEICGSKISSRVSVKQSYEIYHTKFHTNFTVAFSYVTDLGSRKRSINDVVSKAFKTFSHLSAIILNTGAWDFDAVSRRFEFPGPYPFQRATSNCYNNDYEEIRKKRVSQEALSELRDVASKSMKKGAKFYYRTNHYNGRFGIHCADDDLIDNITHAVSQGNNSGDSLSYVGIWDNREISREHWRDQTADGFHFDRDWLHSRADHQHYLTVAPSAVGNPETQGLGATSSSHYTRHIGELEQALVQSMLHRVLHEQLKAASGIHQAMGVARHNPNWGKLKVKDGELVRDGSGKNGRSIFLFKGGALHAFPDWGTYLNMGYNDKSHIMILNEEDFGQIPQGSPLPRIDKKTNKGPKKHVHNPPSSPKSGGQ